MNRTFMLVLHATALASSFLLDGCSSDHASTDALPGQQMQAPGTSAVILIDFSKSFVPLTNADLRALRDLSAGTAKLAKDEWSPPINIVWSRIQTASLLSAPLCRPFDYQPTLIKRSDDGSGNATLDFDGLRNSLDECAASVIQKSAKGVEQAPYTDISGAIDLAVQEGRRLGTKYLLIVSDFVEDLPSGKQPVALKLEGQHVLLLYRAGTQRISRPPLDQMQRVQQWQERLRQAGASSVTALPLYSVTCDRVVRALSTGQKAGTDVLILQNLPNTDQTGALNALANALSKTAADLPSPVTVTWVDARGAGEPPLQMPPVGYSTRLIKTNDVCTTPDPSIELNEWAAGMKRFAPGASNADIDAALKLYVGAGVLNSQHIYFLISSFAVPPMGSLDLKGTRVIMMPGGNKKDEQDEQAYLTRVSGWENWLKEQGATVCNVPLAAVTQNSITAMLDQSRVPIGCK